MFECQQKRQQAIIKFEFFPPYSDDQKIYSGQTNQPDIENLFQGSFQFRANELVFSAKAHAVSSHLEKDIRL